MRGISPNVLPKWLVNLFFLVAAVMLVYSGFQSFQSVEENRRSVDWLLHTKNMISSSQTILTGMSDCESNARAYMLTGLPKFSTRYKSNLGRVDMMLDSMRGHVKDYPNQMTLLDETARHWDIKRVYMDSMMRVIPSAETRQFLGEILSASSGEMDIIRGLMIDLLAKEEELLIDRNKTFLATLTSLKWTGLQAILIAGILLTVGYVGLSLQQKKLIQSLNQGLNLNRELAAMKDNLERQVEIRTAELKAAHDQLSSQYALQKQDLSLKENELADARQFTALMLPVVQMPPLKWEIAVRIRPAIELGGDYYDLRYDPMTDEIILALGDATGHGLMATMIVSQIRMLFRVHPDEAPHQELMDQISRQLMDMRIRTGYMALTLFRISPKGLRYVTAGMPPILIYSAAEDRVTRHTAYAPFLGARAGITYPERELPFGTDDVLLAFSDGITEARNAAGEFFGIDRIEALLTEYVHTTPQALINIIENAVLEWTGDRSPHDDVTLLVLRRLGASIDALESASLTLPARHQHVS